MGRWWGRPRSQSRKGQQVILKSLLDPVPAPAVSARFRRCYDLLSSLDHPNIVRPLAWLDQALPPAFVLEDNQEHQSAPISTAAGVREDCRSRSFLTIACQLADALTPFTSNVSFTKTSIPVMSLFIWKRCMFASLILVLPRWFQGNSLRWKYPEMPEGHLNYIAPEQNRAHELSGGLSLQFLQSGLYILSPAYRSTTVPGLGCPGAYPCPHC